MGARLSPKRLVAVVSGLLTLYSAARVCVLFFEALAVVREGRSEDYELLEICQRGDARGSAKMREACLKARAELASPVVFKAIVQAVSVAFKDFSDTVGSPFKFGVMLLFVISSVMLPIMPWVRAIFGTSSAPDIQPMNGIHYISYAPPPDNRGRLRRVGSKVMKKLKLRSGPVIEDPDDDDARFTEMEPGASMGDGSYETTKPGWTAIDIMGGFGGMPFGGGGRPASPSGHAKYD